MRLLLRRAESAARGYLLSSDPHFMAEYHQAYDQIAPALVELKAKLRDNIVQSLLLTSSEPLVAGRFAATGEAIRLHAAGDSAGIAVLTTRAEGRSLTDSI